MLHRIGDIYAERSERGAADMELLSVTMNDGVMHRSEIEGKDNSSEDKISYKVVCKGDMVYNSMRMWQGANGVSPYDGIVSPAYTVLTAKLPICNDYFAALFKNYKLINEFRKNSQGMTSDTWNLKYPQIETIKVYLPVIEEQEKIASILVTLDKRIAAQAALVEQLKKYKRGALKAVFTQQVSFSAKPQKWDKYKMGDLISLQSGQDFAPAKYNDQEIGVPYMTGASCIVKGETVVSRWTQIPRCYAYKGDTLLVCKGSGSGAVVRLTQEKAHIARQFMSLRANEKMTSDFCYYLTGFLSDRIKRNATGLIEGIDRGTVLNQTVFLPPLHEQNKIARFFSKLDFTITAHENMLDTLINERTGLMQRLFI